MYSYVVPPFPPPSQTPENPQETKETKAFLLNALKPSKFFTSECTALWHHQFLSGGFITSCTDSWPFCPSVTFCLLGCLHVPSCTVLAFLPSLLLDASLLYQKRTSSSSRHHPLSIFPSLWRSLFLSPQCVFALILLPVRT